MFKKNSCGISMGLGFWPWNFHGSWFLTLEFPKSVTQFCKVSGLKSLFSLEFLRWSENFRGFRKVYPQSPCLNFFGIAQYLSKIHSGFSAPGFSIPDLVFQVLLFQIWCFSILHSAIPGFTTCPKILILISFK